MKFTVLREKLLKPLQKVTGVIERRQTLPILSNILLIVKDNHLSLTGTDSEIEMISSLEVENCVSGSITVPARKFMDIVKSLPDDAVIHIENLERKLMLKSGRSRFSLSTLPAEEFPKINQYADEYQCVISQKKLRYLIDKTSFAMAHQDVRYYFNAMFIEIDKGCIKAVATDGHRLARCQTEYENNGDDTQYQALVPRKGILELSRLLDANEESMVNLMFGSSHIRVSAEDFIFTSKLVDGKFPDYKAVIPTNGDKTVIGDRQLLRQAFSRIAILSNEKYRGIRMLISENQMKVVANNPDQEEAEEDISIDYQQDAIEIGFNVNYLLDVLSVFTDQVVKLTFHDTNSSVLIEETQSDNVLYVIMPMRL